MRRTRLEQYVLRAIVGESFSMGEIMRGMPRSLRGRWMGREWKVDEYRRDQLLTLLDETPTSISREHAERGLTFFRSLLRKRFPNSGGTYPEWREDQRTKLFNNQQRRVIEDFSHFLFCGYYDISTNHWPLYMATYHVVANDGSQFTYTPLAWQRSNECCIIH